LRMRGRQVQAAYQISDKSRMAAFTFMAKRSANVVPARKAQ
jgi:hypothetical protein